MADFIGAPWNLMWKKSRKSFKELKKVDGGLGVWVKKNHDFSCDFAKTLDGIGVNGKFSEPHLPFLGGGILNNGPIK